MSRTAGTKPGSPETDYVPMPHGDYQEALTWVGKRTEPERARLPIELGLIRDFAGLVEDSNPCYWDPELSQQIWGAQVAPAGLLRSMFCPPRWAPGLRRTAPLASQVPLPGQTLINVESGQTFLRPLRCGDYLSIVEEVVEISPEKVTRLGRGHFVITETTYTDDAGEVLATGYGKLLRFTPADRNPASPGPEPADADAVVVKASEQRLEPGPATGRRFRGRDWSEVAVGDQLDEVVLPIKFEMVAGHIAGTRDWFPGHHNPEYARAQGQQNIYANTMFFQGFLERVALDWAGPAWYVSRRTLRIGQSVYPGDTLVGYGRVENRGNDGDRFTVDLTVSGRTRSSTPAIAATIQLSMSEASRNWWSKHR